MIAGARARRCAVPRQRKDRARGRIDALRARLAMPATTREFGARLFGNRPRCGAIERRGGRGRPARARGLMPPYAIPNVAIDHVPVDVGLPTGRLRGNAHGYTAFIIESFIDEVARPHRAGAAVVPHVDARQDLRLADCLQRAARLAEWDGGAGRSGQGIACWRIGDPTGGGPVARIACVATARAGEGGVRVERLAAAVDIGRVVNRDIALQQIEGGLIFGVGLAIGSALSYADGLAGRRAARRPRAADAGRCPEIAVELIPTARRAVRSGRDRRGRRSRPRSPTRCIPPPACACAACRCYRGDYDLATATLPADHPPVRSGGVGVLLVNLGTPDAPDAAGGEALSRRVPLGPPRGRDPAAGVAADPARRSILNTRPKKSAHAYSQVWTEAGSPLAAITAEQAQALQERLGESVHGRATRCVTAARRSAPRCRR